MGWIYCRMLYAHTNPVNDNGQVTEYVIKKAAQADLVRVYPVAAISKGLEGKALCEFAELRRAGAIAVSDDGNPVTDSRLMRKAMEQAKACGLGVISHCEDLGLAAGFQSLGRNTLFDGWHLTGKPVFTLVAGRIVFDDSIH